MIVVQDQHHYAWHRGQVVDQRSHHRLQRASGRAKQVGERLPGPFPRAAQRGGDVPPKPHRVVIAGVQRQPRHRPAAAPRPVGQHYCLTEPGRRAHHRQLTRQRPGQPLNQTRAGHQAVTPTRDMQLGRQQRVQPCRAILGRGRYLRFTHGMHPPWQEISLHADCRARRPAWPSETSRHTLGVPR